MPEGTVEALDGVETDLGVAGPAEVSVGHVDDGRVGEEARLVTSG